MKEPLFSNEVILSWLQYYAQNTAIDLEHVKMLDITKKNKNVIPTVEAHKTTLVFTNAGVRIDNEHSGGSIDSAVDHILYFAV